MSALANTQNKQLKILLRIVSVMLFTISTVHAQNATWVGTTSDINTASNWSPSGVPSSGNTYTFDNTGITTTVTGNPAAGVLIVVNSSSGVKDYTISGVLSGATTITKNGTSRLTLTGTNTYSGVTNVNAGILNIQNNSALGNTTNGTIISSGGKLELQNNITVTGEALTLNGGSFVSATGGAITYSGAHNIHTFTNSGTFSVSSGGTVEYLIVGGGGGGLGSDDGGEGGGGGGAGGVVYGFGTRTPGSYAVSVGAGGAGGIIENDAANGSNSVFGTLIALGGGGSTRQEAVPATSNAGGSGAGGFGRGEAGGNATQPGSGSGGFGNAGGNGGTNPGGGGGGGGANSAGSTGGANNGGNGGGGNTYNISGASVAYAGGGGGGVRLSGTAGTASAGGGAGGTAGNLGSNATANTGGGGGGGGGNGTTYQKGGDGGSGVVILRYLNSGALENVSGDNYWTGTVTLLADNIITTTTGTLTVSGIISGAYALTKNGSGTLTFSNANTYSGGTAINTGKLNINNASALGASAGSFTINGGTIDNTSGAAITAVNYPQLWNADFTFSGTNNLNLGVGAVTLSASRQITTTSNTLTIGGLINDNTKSLTKAGAGTLAFGAQAVTLNTITINAGSLTSTSGTLNLSGDFINNGTYSHNNGLISFVGATSTSVTGTANGTSTHNFYDVTVNKSGSATITVPVGITNQINNSMTLTNGIVNQNGTLSFLNGSSVSGANNASYVNGQVVKFGTQAFTFPVGAGNFYRPVSISAPAVSTDNFTAQYFLTDPSPSYTHTSKDATIDHVGRCEYWILNRTGGSSNVNVTLSWNSTSCGVTNLADLLVARWDAGTNTWKNQGNGGTTGNTTAGTVISGSLVTSFSPFTLGSSTGNNPLPIELLDFTASINDKQVNINWNTATEINNNYFTVERSQDAIHFEFVAKVPATGNSNTLQKYATQDEKPYPGLSYYRLKQVDFDGTFNYSKIVAIDFFNEEFGLKIYPNPTSDLITIDFLEQVLPPSTRVSLTNVYGQQLELNQIISKNQINMDLSPLPSGIYFVGITLGEKTIERKIVLQK